MYQRYSILSLRITYMCYFLRCLILQNVNVQDIKLVSFLFQHHVFLSSPPHKKCESFSRNCYIASTGFLHRVPLLRRDGPPTFGFFSTKILFHIKNSSKFISIPGVCHVPFFFQFNFLLPKDSLPLALANFFPLWLFLY